MLLETLSLTNFRNYQERSFSFSSNITIILGPNTSGKTSVLEAIMLFSTGKSFRAEREQEMIHADQEVGRVKIKIKDEKTQIVSAHEESSDTIEVDVVKDITLEVV